MWHVHIRAKSVKIGLESVGILRSVDQSWIFLGSAPKPHCWSRASIGTLPEERVQNCHRQPHGLNSVSNTLVILVFSRYTVEHIGLASTVSSPKPFKPRRLYYARSDSSEHLQS